MLRDGVTHFIDRARDRDRAEMSEQRLGKLAGCLAVGAGNDYIERLHKSLTRDCGVAAERRSYVRFASDRSPEGAKGSAWSFPFCFSRISTLPSASSSSLRQLLDNS